ncbi:MAG: ComF family protein [Anaerolineales bacterium]|nr:ComF family protein [Anaerolineales bacterium]
MAMAVPNRPVSIRRPWRFWARQLAWAGVDIVFPPHCAGCGRPGARLCSACQSTIQDLARPLCALCGYPLLRGSGPACRVCLGGRRSIAPLAGLRSAAFFQGPLQQALHRFKYKHDVILADTLGERLARSATLADVPAGLVVPVPLSAERLAERGYNQAALLARAFAELRGLPFTTRGVRRVRHTPPQVRLNAEQRHANMAGAFAVEGSPPAGRTILLVDDVCTTGATLAACAAALLAGGAQAVWGLTLARAPYSGALWARDRARAAPSSAPA